MVHADFTFHSRSILQYGILNGRHRKKHQTALYPCLYPWLYMGDVWRNGNDAIGDGLNWPVPEVDTEAGWGPRILFVYGAQVWGARCHMWWVKFRVRWYDCWNDEPCFFDFDSEHLATATFFRHRQRHASEILGSADHVISESQVLHCTLFRRRPTSFRNCISKPWLQNTNRWGKSYSDDRLLATSDVHTETSARTASPAGVSCTRLPLHRVFVWLFVETRRRLRHTTVSARRMAVTRVQGFEELAVVHKERGEKVNGKRSTSV